MRAILLTILIFLYCILTAQDIKLPLEMKGTHMYSQWKLNDSIDVKVFLETGFPRIIFNETFAEKHLQGIVNMVKASENSYIILWNNDDQKYKITYLINDSLIINGKKLKIDAVVVDVTKQKSWENCDMIFPLRDLNGKVEINVREKYMEIFDEYNALTDFVEYNVNYDNRIKGLYLTTTMKIFDTEGNKEELNGNFLLDLGAGGAFFLNKNLQNVLEFISQSDRMVLKDTTRFTPNTKNDLSIIMPDQIQIENIKIKDSFIAAMKILPNNTNNYVGIIGNPFFENFIVIFDFENNKLYIKPNSDKVKIIE